MSPTGGARIRVEEVDGQSCVHFRTRAKGCFDAVSLNGLVVSPDGLRFAIPVQTGGSWQVMWNDTLGPGWNGVAELVLGPNGHGLAYAAEDVGGWRVVVDGKPEPLFDSLFASSLQWDPTGDRVGYVAARGGERFVVVGGRPLGPYPGVGTFMFDRNGSFAFVAPSKGRVALVVDGVVVRQHEAVDHLVPEATGRGFAYAFRRGDAWWTRGADDELGPFTGVRELIPLDGGAGPLVILESAGGARVIVAADYRGPDFEEVEPPVTDRAARRWGYIGRDSIESTVLVEGDTVSQERWASDLTLSEVGGRWAFLSHRADGIYVVDDSSASRFDHVVSGTLAWIDAGNRWAVLVGDLDRRRLWIAVEGLDQIRDVDWNEIVEVTTGMQAGVSDAALHDELLRIWVAEQASALLDVPAIRPGQESSSPSQDERHKKGEEVEGDGPTPGQEPDPGVGVSLRRGAGPGDEGVAHGDDAPGVAAATEPLHGNPDELRATEENAGQALVTMHSGRRRPHHNGGSGVPEDQGAGIHIPGACRSPTILTDSWNAEPVVHEVLP